MNDDVRDMSNRKPQANTQVDANVNLYMQLVGNQELMAARPAGIKNFGEESYTYREW